MKGSYSKLIIMLGISFVVMYSVMFLNVEKLDHIYLSMTRLYMALLMVTPMAVYMVLMMKDMYMNRKLNMIIIFSSIMIFMLSVFFLRSQIPIGDSQYMKAMIPHHSSAILTSKNASIADPEVKELARKIIESQEKEISEMKALLKKLDEK